MEIDERVQKELREVQSRLDILKIKREPISLEQITNIIEDVFDENQVNEKILTFKQIKNNRRLDE